MKPALLYMLLAILSFQQVAIASEADHRSHSGETRGLPDWDAKIYPNPNNGVFSLMITGTSAALDVVVFNIIGDKVFEMQILGDHGAKIDLSGLQKGLYVVQVIDRNRSQVLTRRMHIE